MSVTLTEACRVDVCDCSCVWAVCTTEIWVRTSERDCCSRRRPAGVEMVAMYDEMFCVSIGEERKQDGVSQQ